MKITKYLLLLIVFCLGIQPINKVKSLPFMIPVISYTIGAKVTKVLIVQCIVVAALFAYSFKKSRELPDNDRDLLNKIEKDAGRGGGGGGDKDPKWDKSKWLNRAAEILGLKKLKDRMHGQATYQDGANKISFDADGHNGGFWKVFNKKDERIGTFNITLEKQIGK